MRIVRLVQTDEEDYWLRGCGRVGGRWSMKINIIEVAAWIYIIRTVINAIAIIIKVASEP